jgi:hypothetical protein
MAGGLAAAAHRLNGAHGIFGDANGTLFLAEIQPNGVTRMRLLS